MYRRGEICSNVHVNVSEHYSLNISTIASCIMMYSAGLLGICMKQNVAQIYAGFLYVVGWNRRALSVIGAWPESSDTIFTRLRAVICFILIFVTIYLPLVISLFVLWGNLDAMSECLIVNGPVALGLVKDIVFWYYRKDIRKIIEEMNHDWFVSKSTEEHNVMMEFGIISRFITVSSVILGNTLAMSFIIFQVYFGMTQKDQPNPNPHMPAGFLYPVYLPYNTREKETFLPTWVAQCVSTFFSITIYAGFDAFFSAVILHVCGQLKVVGLSIRDLYCQDNSTDICEFQKKLSCIIQRHQNLIDLVDLIQVLSSPVLLPQMIMCTVIFCFQGYVLITSILEYSGDRTVMLQIVYIVVFICYTVLHLFVYCEVGEYLVVESVNVGSTGYNGHWYNLDYRQARSLINVDQRTQKPLVITAANFCVFSRNLFLKVLKTSFGYLSMLLTVESRLSADEK